MEKSELHEILHALKLHTEHIDNKLSSLENRMDERITALEYRMDERFNRLENKVDGIRADLIETQENVNFLLSKNAQHEKKLQNLINQPSQ